jgi:GNAT superfamily N-acetyltransferase
LKKEDDMTFRIEVFKGISTAPYLQTLSDLRLEAFKEFPYLYVGNIEDEVSYAQLYTSAPEGILVIAFQDETIAGLYSGLPLNASGAFISAWHDKLIEEGVDLTNYFYAGELIVKPAFRKKGLGAQLMTRLIQEVDAMGFSGFMGVTAIRAYDHPLRPQGYFDTDAIWGKYGLEKIPVVLTGTWPTLQLDGSIKVEDNQLACWIRKKSR